MADTAILWRGLTIGGGGDYHVEELTGWDELPEITDYNVPRSRGHGDHLGDQFARSRIITASGTIASPTARNALALALSAVSPVSSAVEDLTVQTFGQQLTVGARLIKRSLPIAELYAAGLVPFALQWKCPDPLRYSSVQSASTGLATAGGGMTFPMTFPLDFGTAGTPGQLTLTNAGTADAPVVFTVTGPLVGGFEISSGGQRITYATDVGAGEVLTIDTGAGTVLTGGTADRRANLVNADWMQIPAGQAVTVQFTALGAYDPAALLAASWRSAWW